MSMSGVSGSRQGISGINVTPLIDVLLVLLIIFMVIVPVTPSGLKSVLPQPPKTHEPAVDAAIVVQVEAVAGGEPSYRINGTPFSKSQLQAELASIFAARQNRVLFVKGDTSLEFNTIAEVVDIGHRANVDTIGLLGQSGAPGR